MELQSIRMNFDEQQQKKLELMEAQKDQLIKSDPENYTNDPDAFFTLSNDALIIKSVQYMANKGISLYQLNNQIKGILNSAFDSEVWIIAEISELRYNQNGHCYLELVEKDEDSDKIIAKARATIWSYTFRMLKPYFETATGQRFSSGIKVLIHASIEFQEIYGYSLNIKDIDPSYTLGDIARRRKEILNRLEEEGVLEMNKELDFPDIPKMYCGNLFANGSRIRRFHQSVRE